MQTWEWGKITANEITHRVAMDPDNITPSLNGYRPAAVLVPFLKIQDEWRLLFTRRTMTVNSHKGQVSFPGGSSEGCDHSPEETALRESYEEIGLRPQDVTILGRMPSMATVSKFLITPVLGLINWPYPFTTSSDEVSRIFTIPLEWLADPDNREERLRIHPSGIEEQVIYYKQYDGEMLWGISARITVNLLKVLNQDF